MQHTLGLHLTHLTKDRGGASHEVPTHLFAKSREGVPISRNKREVAHTSAPEVCMPVASKWQVTCSSMADCKHVVLSQGMQLLLHGS